MWSRWYYFRMRCRLRKQLRMLSARKAGFGHGINLHVVGGGDESLRGARRALELSDPRRLARQVRRDFGRPPPYRLKIMVIYAPDIDEFGKLAAWMGQSEPKRFSGTYFPTFGAVLVTEHWSSELFRLTVFHEVVHALAHTRYGFIDPPWSVEGYACLLTLRHARHSRFAFAREYDLALSAARSHARVLHVGDVISMTAAQCAALSHEEQLCFRTIATQLTVYLLAQAEKIPDGLDRWRRAMGFNGASSAEGVAELARALGLTMNDLDEALFEGRAV